MIAAIVKVRMDQTLGWCGTGLPSMSQVLSMALAWSKNQKDHREEPNWKSVNENLCEAQGLVVQQEPHTVCNDVPNRKENHAEKNQCSRYPIKGGPPHSPKIKGSHPRLCKARAVGDQVQAVDKGTGRRKVEDGSAALPPDQRFTESF